MVCTNFLDYPIGQANLPKGAFTNYVYKTRYTVTKFLVVLGKLHSYFYIFDWKDLARKHQLGAT